MFEDSSGRYEVAGVIATVGDSEQQDAKLMSMESVLVSRLREALKLQ